MSFVYTVKCERMDEGWNYDTCAKCKRFSITVTNKGHKWRCKLNNSTAAERRNFQMIWTIHYLIARGALNESVRSDITVEYVGKKKRRRNKATTDNKEPG